MYKDKFYGSFETLELYLFSIFGFLFYPHLNTPLTRRISRALLFEGLDKDTFLLVPRISCHRRGIASYSETSMLDGISKDHLPWRWRLSVDTCFVQKYDEYRFGLFIYDYMDALEKRVEATINGKTWRCDPFELVIDGQLSIVDRDNDVFSNSRSIIEKSCQLPSETKCRLLDRLDMLERKISEYFS